MKLKNCPTCLQFEDFKPSNSTEKLYLNSAQTVMVNCPDGTTPSVTIPAGVVGFVLDFTLGNPPYPDLTLNCIGGQINVSVPDNVSQKELDALINGMLDKCAAQIGLQTGCVPGEFQNTIQTYTGCPNPLDYVNIVGGVPVGIGPSSDGHSLSANSGLIFSTVSVDDANKKTIQLLKELFATRNVICSTNPPPPNPPPTPDLRWYKFTEGSGSTTVDYSPAGHNASGISGGATWSTGPIGGGAINLAGSTSVNGALAAIATIDFSYSCWVNMPTAPVSGVYQMFEIFDAVATMYRSVFAINTASNEKFQALSPTNDGTGGTVAIATWTMLTMTYVNSTGLMSFYVDGVPAGTGTNSTALVNPVGGGLYVGGSGAFGRQTFVGKIADWRVYGVALTDQNVLDIFNLGAQ